MKKRYCFLVVFLVAISLFAVSNMREVYAEGDNTNRDGIIMLNDVKKGDIIINGAGEYFRWKVLDTVANNGDTNGIFTITEGIVSSNSVKFVKKIPNKYKDGEVYSWCQTASHNVTGLMSTQKTDQVFSYGDYAFNDNEWWGTNLYNDGMVN